MCKKCVHKYQRNLTLGDCISIPNKYRVFIFDMQRHITKMEISQTLNI